MSCGTVPFFAAKCLLVFVLFLSIYVNGFLSGSKRGARNKRFTGYQISGYVDLSAEISRTPDVSPDLEEIMLQTKGTLKNNANITKDLVTNNTSRESVSHIPDDCDPFLNENGCLSILQKDDIYIKIIDTDSKYRGENQPYRRVEKYSRNSKRKRKKQRKNRMRKQRNKKRKNKNNQRGNSSVNGTSGKKPCQTGSGNIETPSKECSGNTNLNTNSNLESKLPTKYWTVPKFVLVLREKLIEKIKQLYKILRNGVGETIRKILHSYMQIHKRYKEIKEKSRNVLIAGHESVIEVIEISEQIYGTISSMNELTRRLYSRKVNKVSPHHRRVNHHFAVIKVRNRHTHLWDSLKALDKMKTVKNKVLFIDQFTRVYDYSNFYEKIRLLKEHVFNQRTRLIDLLDISRHVNYTHMYYPHTGKLKNVEDISITRRDLMDEHYNIKSRIRTVNKNINNIRLLHTSCSLKLHHLSEIDFAAAIKSHVAKRKNYTEAEKRQVRKWAYEVKEHISDMDDVMEIIHGELQPSLHLGKNTTWRFRNEKQNDDSNVRLERLRKKVHIWTYMKRFRNSKQKTTQKDGKIRDKGHVGDGRGSVGRGGHGKKWNRQRKRKRNFFKKIGFRRRRDVTNADQGKDIHATFEEIEQKLTEIIKKLDEAWENILRFINAKKRCKNGEDAVEGSGDADLACNLDGSTDDRDDLITKNKDSNEEDFEFIDSKNIVPINTKRLLDAYTDDVTVKSEKVKSRCNDVQKDIQDLKPELAQVSSELSRIENLSNKTNFLQNYILEFLSNNTKYKAELNETNAKLKLILSKIETMNNLAEKVLADEDNLRELLEERKKAKEKQAKDEEKEKVKNKVGKKKKKSKSKKNTKQQDTSERSGGKRNSKDEEDDGDSGVDVVSPRRNKKKERDKVKKESESDVSLGDEKNFGNRGNRKKTEKHSGRNRDSKIVNRRDRKINGQRKKGNSDVREMEDKVEGEEKRGKKRKEESKRKNDVKKKVKGERKKQGEKDEKEDDKIGGSKDKKDENWLDVWEDLINFEDLVKENESLKLVSGETSRNKSSKSEHEGKTRKDENNDRKKMLVLKKNDGRNEKKQRKGKNEENKSFRSKKKKSKNEKESKEKSGSESTKKENWLDLWENLVESQTFMKENGSEDWNGNEENGFQNEQNVAQTEDGYYKKQQEREDEEIKDVKKKNRKNVGKIANIKNQKHSRKLTKEDEESRKSKLKLKIKRLQRYRRDLRSIRKGSRSSERRKNARWRRQMRKKRRKSRRNNRTSATLQSDTAEDEDATIKFVAKVNKQIEINVAKSKENIDIMNKTLQELPRNLYQSVTSNVEQLRLNISQIQQKIHLARTLLSAMKIPVKFTGKDYLKVPLHFGYDSRKIQSSMDVCVKPKLKSGTILGVKVNDSVSYILGLEKSAVFLSVYDTDGRTLKTVESKQKTKPDVWYKFGVERTGRTFSMTVSPISTDAEANDEVVKLFLPKITADYISPSVAYIGGYPEELWKSKLKQLEGCVGSLDVDGRAMALMQPFSDGSQPKPCKHGCGDNSSIVFEGNGFAEFQADSIPKTGLTSIQLSFKTYQTDALLLFLKNTNFVLIVTLESGNIRIQYELEDTKTAKLSGPGKLSNGTLHKLQISIKNGKFNAGIVNGKLKFDDTEYKSEKNELEAVFSLGGLSNRYQNNTVSHYKSLTGCLSNVWLNHKEVSLLQLQDARHVQLGNCDKNLWLSCVQFTKNSKPLQLPDFDLVKSISIKVSHQAHGVALFFEREEKFAIGVKLEDSLVEVMNHMTDDKSKVYRNASTALWNVISVEDQVGNLHISLDGQSIVNVSYTINTGGWFDSNEKDFSMTITVGGLSKDYQDSSKKSETLYGSISAVLIENKLVDLRRQGVSNQIDVCSKPVGA